MTDEICFQGVLFDEVFVAIEKDPPVDVFGVITRYVFPVSGKFHCEPGQRRPVASRQRTQDQVARFKDTVCDPVQ